MGTPGSRASGRLAAAASALPDFGEETIECTSKVAGTGPQLPSYAERSSMVLS